MCLLAFAVRRESSDVQLVYNNKKNQDMAWHLSDRNYCLLFTPGAIGRETHTYTLHLLFYLLPVEDFVLTGQELTVSYSIVCFRLKEDRVEDAPILFGHRSQQSWRY